MLEDTQFNLLEIHFSSDLTKLPSLNYQNALDILKLRHFTPVGKITVTLILYLLIYLWQ